MVSYTVNKYTNVVISISHCSPADIACNVMQDPCVDLFTSEHSYLKIFLFIQLSTTLLCNLKFQLGLSRGVLTSKKCCRLAVLFLVDSLSPRLPQPVILPIQPLIVWPKQKEILEQYYIAIKEPTVV